MFFRLFATTLVLSCASVYASPLTWTLSGLTFNDGGAASGTFSYDADTGTFSNIDITTTAGTSLPGGDYLVLGDALTSGAEFLSLVSTPINTLFNLELSSAMTDAGGTIPLFLDPLGEATAGEETCYSLSPDCLLVNAGGPSRFSVNGEVTAPESQTSGAPEPATGVLLLGGLGYIVSRRLLAANKRS